MRLFDASPQSGKDVSGHAGGMLAQAPATVCMGTGVLALRDWLITGVLTMYRLMVAGKRLDAPAVERKPVIPGFVGFVLAHVRHASGVLEFLDVLAPSIPLEAAGNGGYRGVEFASRVLIGSLGTGLRVLVDSVRGVAMDVRC